MKNLSNYPNFSNQFYLNLKNANKTLTSCEKLIANVRKGNQALLFFMSTFCLLICFSCIEQVQTKKLETQETKSYVEPKIISEFDSIDFRGKKSYLVPSLCKHFMNGAHNWVDKNDKEVEDHSKGEEVLTYYYSDYGTIWFQFDKNEICYKVKVKVKSNVTLKFKNIVPIIDPKDGSLIFQ
jgi:hypothetical protein